MLNSPIRSLEKIGPSYENKLRNLDIHTIENLLYHFPVRYEDRRVLDKLNNLVLGQKASVEGVIWQIKTTRTKYGKFLTFATINDGTSSLECVWFNQAYINRVIKSGQKLGFSGKVENFNGKLTLINPEYEFISPNSFPIHTRGLVPVYPETKGVSSKWLRSKISWLIKSKILTGFEILPNHILKRYNLIGWTESIKNIHFPANLDQINRAKKRLAFEELFLLQLEGKKIRLDWQENLTSYPFVVDRKKIDRFIAELPFSLTKAQKTVLKEIYRDLGKNKPMNRLLQGDVGSGKTIVAVIISYIAFLNKKEVVFMAPTEILANQHFKTLSSLLNPYGMKVGLQTGSTKTKSKVNLQVGTHALITSKILTKNIGLIIIDEQQRFGVKQRSLLRKRNTNAHYLTMSATPIPRTMALTLYGDLDLSIIDELPVGRKKVRTFVVPPEKRDRAYTFIRKHLRKGSQAFIICPLIDPSETLVSVKSATAEWEKLKTKIFPEYSVDLLHGRLKSKEKNAVITKFKKGKSDVLVSTPVVEVGIDVPNATIMVVEAAERFGLAQLHQIRGRVGRGSNESFCLLFTESQDLEVLKRLAHMETSHLGLELAELDLKIRGPGQLLGTAQHGVKPLKIADLSNNDLINKSKIEAEIIIKSDPKLNKHPLLKSKLASEKMSPD